MLNNNKFVFVIFVFAFVLCTSLYSALGLAYLDEILIASIALYTFFTIFRNRQIDKEYLFFLAVLLFYAFYSFWLAEIDKRAILSDILQQSKPFIIFFSIYQLKPSLTDRQKVFIKFLSLVIFVLTVILFAIERTYGVLPFDYFPHVAVYGQMMFTTALMYLYASNRTKSDILVFILIITLGLFSTRSKYYGEFLFALICLWKIHSPVKFSLKYILLSLISITIIIIAVWSKFNSYFVEGIDSDEMARPILYNTSIEIASDYFPFGSGYGSFAEDASRVWYSPIYDKYGISNVWGLSRNYNDFAADTFFPVIIGQFGVIGIFLFILFWRSIIKKLNRFFTNRKYKIDYNIALIIIVQILIESVAGPMFVTTYAIAPIMLLAIILSDLQRNQNEKIGLENIKN